MVDCGTLTIESTQASIGVAGCSTNPSSGSEIEPAQQVTVNFTLENTGDAAGTIEVTLTAAGQQIESVQVSVPAGQSRNGEFTFRPSDFGITGPMDVVVTGGAGSSGLTADGGTSTRLSRLGQTGCHTCGQ